MTTHHLFERPELLDNQTRLILSADAKPKRLIRSATRSAGHSSTQERPSSRGTALVFQETEDELLDENVEFTNDNQAIQQTPTLSDEVDYDTDIEQEQEKQRDYNCKSVYIDECRRYGVIPSTLFLRSIENDTLAICYCGLKPASIKVMVPSLKINSTITKLDLRDNSMGSRGAMYIAQLIDENEYIDELNLANNDIGTQGCKALCRVLVSNRSIRRLYLDGNRFNDDCASSLAEVFAQNDFLTYVNLNKNFLENDETGRLFGKALSENQTLEEIHLGWNRLSSKACANFLKPLSANTSITTIDLSWNGAALLAAKAINDLLGKTTTLEKFYLNNNKFNTECATYIGKGLSKNETLQILTLNGNPLESSGCYAVLRPLVKHPTSRLQWIDLQGIIVNKDLLDLVQEVLGVLSQLNVKLGTDRDPNVD